METDKALCMYDVKSSTNMAIAYEVKQNYVFHKNILLSFAARDNSQPSTVLLFTNNLLCDLRNTFLFNFIGAIPNSWHHFDAIS